MKIPQEVGRRGLTPFLKNSDFFLPIPNRFKHFAVENIHTNKQYMKINTGQPRFLQLIWGVKRLRKSNTYRGYQADTNAILLKASLEYLGTVEA
jgi:hypothetical protein